jgi:isoquinoline 1-oxidoreductase beta subunit
MMNNESTTAATYRLSRRSFLLQTAAVGGALVVGFHWPETAGAQDSGGAAGADNANEVNAWIVINPDDSVIIRVARSEIGQGSFTGLAMLVAEELECDWSKVSAEYASTSENLRRDRIFGSMSTGGSRAIRDSQEYLRQAGAAARQMLIAAAAQRWGVAAGECTAANSMISHGSSGQQLSFGAVAADAAKLPAPVPSEVALKDPQDWKIIGQPLARFDIPAKVDGSQKFAIDTRLPDMLYAAIAQCPVFGGKLVKADAEAIAGRRGIVQVVPLEDAVAVVADNWWRAQQALNELPIEWDFGDNGAVSSASIMEFLRSGINDDSAPVSREEGNIDQAFADAAQVVEAEYYAPYLEHATMEPQNCTAYFHDGKLDVWAPTQNSEASIAAAAEAGGIDIANVEYHKLHVGGGFGRRGAFQEYVRQGVAIAKTQPGKPVKLVWSREEDIQHGHYRPVALVSMRAALDKNNEPTAWQVKQADQSIIVNVRPSAIENGIDPINTRVFSDSPYAFPNQKMQYAMRNTHVPTGFWRSVAHSNNPFFRESFIDEIAHAGGHDPYELRRKLLANAEKDLGVLDAAATAAGWGDPLPDGVHRGIAVQDGYGSYNASVVEVSVDAGDMLKIHRVVMALDPGYVVNPDSVRAQIEGCMIYGLTAALYGEITIENGRVMQSNFHDYQMMRLAETPPIEIVLVPSGGFWGGVGEPSNIAMTPALANAIFAATGKRIRSLPLKNHGFRTT